MKKINFSTRILFLLRWVSFVISELSYEECRVDDVLFTNPRMSLEINVTSDVGSRLTKTIKSPSESHCFSKCKNVVECNSATFFAEAGDSKCLLKDTNRFGVRNRIKISATGKYFEKTDGCSILARQRRQVIGMVDNAIDCNDALKKGWKKDGVYLIKRPDEDTYRPIRCRMSILGGGWTIIQRRVDGSLSFDGDWDYYKHGFGEVSREFWYGNENIHNLTKNGDSEVIFELQDTNGVFYYPFYQSFTVGSEEVNYKLSVGPFEHRYGPPLPQSNKKDSFLYHDGQEFSTKERDNDEFVENCSVNNYGSSGWWYKACAQAQLNGALFGVDGENNVLRWPQITDIVNDMKTTLKSSEMMVRRKS